MTTRNNLGKKAPSLMENRTSDTQVCPHIHAPQGVIYSLHSFEAVPDNTCWKNIRILYRKHNLHRPLCYLCVSNLFTVHLVWPCDASNTCLYFTEREREPLGKQDCSTDWGYTHVRTHTHTLSLTHTGGVGSGWWRKDCQCHIEWKWRCRSQMPVPVV